MTIGTKYLAFMDTLGHFLAVRTKLGWTLGTYHRLAVLGILIAEHEVMILLYLVKNM